LEQLWLQTMRALDLDPAPSAAPIDPRRPVSFYLHNYATYLGRQDDIGQVHHACTLFERTVIPNRRAYYTRTGEFRPLLHSLQNATPANSRLAAHAAERGDVILAAERAGVGRGWILDALDAPYTRQLLDRASVDASDEACRFALLAVPALLLALEQRISDEVPADIRRCEDLLEVAGRFAERIGKTGGHYSRSPEIVAAHNRLDRYLTGSTSA
jgi:hypothetical protein